MKHYCLLEKHQEVRFKDFLKRHTDALKNIESEERDERDPKSKMLLLAAAMDDRDTKIANYKFKKTLEQNLDRLKDYKDESMKRDFYKCQIQLSIMSSLDQLAMTEMELNVLCHQASLSYEQHLANERKSSEAETGTLKVVKLLVSKFNIKILARRRAQDSKYVPDLRKTFRANAADARATVPGRSGASLRRPTHKKS